MTTALALLASIVPAIAALQPPAQPPTAPGGAEPAAGEEVGKFTIRQGYAVSVAVEYLPGARMLEVDPSGTLYVSRHSRGDVIALRDEDGDGVFERREVFLSGLPMIHGMCFFEGSLWFATSGKVGRARDTDGDLKADEVKDIIPTGQLPSGGGHWYRSLLVTPDAIYTSIGDSGNISDQMETERQKIWAFSLEGTEKRLYCSGIRNTEKLRLRPGTFEIWGVDHGSDWFGAGFGEYQGKQGITDLNPPDELNRYVEGAFYGHPFIVGNRVPRQEYRDRPDLLDLAEKTVPPDWSIPAHWAANGFCFVEEPRKAGPGAMPVDHRGDVFVACRGSWNSTRPVGYCVARILFDDGRPYGLLPIVTTLDAPKAEVHARPVDCVQHVDGSVLFSSDQPGRIYRITHTGLK